MSKAERIRAQSSRQKVAAQQAAARRAETRRRAMIAAGSVALVVALVIVLIVVRLNRSPASAGVASAAADAAITRQIAAVPASAFNLVGGGTAAGLKAISGQPELAASGKPELLYMGGEFCPYCAAERWAIAVAASRFGTLSGLHFIHSSPTDVYPSTPTLSFYRSRYASKYLDFVPVEWYGERPDPSTPFQHVYLQHPSQQQVALFTRYANGSIPFVDIGNRYVVPNAQYLPSDLAGLSWAQVAAAMHEPSSTVGKDIVGAANMITAAICKVTQGQPGNVCTSAGVTAASKSI
jgi:thiol-disulfide isomerase/thioredoxin